MIVFIIALAISVVALLAGVQFGYNQAHREYQQSLQERADVLQRIVDDSDRREKEMNEIKKKMAELITLAVKAGLRP